METWNVRINNILKHDITKLDNTLIPSDVHGDTKTIRQVQDTISAIIDRLGELSAAAQGLNRVITTGTKMRCSQNALYLLKDPKANNGQGDVIGLLKMGHKHLYLGDHGGNVHEVEPLCVLDFFVQSDRQRHGLGKKLFDFMLQDVGAQPHHLAVDGPSPVMLLFLEKTYGMKNMIRHPNNFAVAPAFFDDINKISKSGCSTPASASSGAGRFTAPKPQSGIGKIIHGGGAQEIKTMSIVSPEEELGAGAAQQWPELPSPVETEAGDRTPPGEVPLAERPSSLLVEAAAAAAVAAGEPPALSPAGSTASRRDSQLTEKGFFDVKFYHNKLW